MENDYRQRQNLQKEIKRPANFFWVMIVFIILFCLSGVLNIILLMALMTDIASAFDLEEKVVSKKYKERLIGGEPDVPEKILLLPVKGVIVSPSNLSFYRFMEIGPVQWVKDVLKLCEQDHSIRAIILEVDSPGGSITSCDQIYTALRRFKEKRPDVYLVTSMGEVAASGGYYIAQATDYIVAHPTTLTGSIGVIATVLNAEKLLEKIGLKQENIKSGDKKDIGSIARPMTEEERMILQTIIDEMYQRFVEVVVKGRPQLNKQDIITLADGRIYSGEQAFKNKLVDELGDREDAFKIAKRLAKLDKARLIEYKRRHHGLINLFMTHIATLSSEQDLTSAIKRLLIEQNTPQLWYLWSAK